jgi:2-iminobutanoate/2-iminopropanoate deaminase
MNRTVATGHAPAAVGPYSQGIAADGGRMLFVSGQLPIDPATGWFAGEGIAEQTERSIRNIEAVLTEAGFSLKDVVKTTVFLRDIEDFAAMNQVYARFFSENPPARSAVQVAAIPKGAAVEIEAIAVKSLP